MKPLWLAAAGLLVNTAAGAQSPAIQSAPLPPLQQQWQQQGIPPVQRPAPYPSDQGQAAPGQIGQGQFDQGQAPQGQPAQGQPAQGQPAQEQTPPGQIVPGPTMPGQTVPGQTVPGQTADGQPAPPATFDRPNNWLPATTVKLQALDKVNAQSTALTIKVGASATFGSLTITAKACVVRPPDQPADAAAYLNVTDSHPEAPRFDGWMLQDEPSISMLQHPIYDLRVIGCT
jgi:hypothetical protein